MNTRKSIRLPGYDYTKCGFYFITICTNNRVKLFGEIDTDKMRLNEAGEVTERCWNSIPNHFPHASLDHFIVMPNHVHGIIFIHEQINSTESKHLDEKHHGTSKTIGSMVRGFKTGVTQWFKSRGHVGDIWQRNYYEHIVRNERELELIRQYIQNNPQMWNTDKLNGGEGNTIWEPRAIYGEKAWMV